VSRRKLTRSRYRRDAIFHAAYPKRASKAVVSPSPGITSPKMTRGLIGRLVNNLPTSLMATYKIRGSSDHDSDLVRSGTNIVVNEGK
jgi:hypothetical protein